MTDKYNMAIYVFLLIIVLFAAFQYYSLALKLTQMEIERHGKGYVSDEVWYVPSARNILRKTLGIIPSLPGGKYGASIIYNGNIEIAWIRKIAIKYNVSVVDENYHKIKAFYVESNNLNNINAFIQNISEYYSISDIVYGWRIPDADGINEYLNLEHPPLVKYLIALSILYLGDYPLYWRVPNIIAGALIVFFVFLSIRKLTNNPWLGLIASLLVSVDPIMRYLSSIALLDVFVALFSVITFYLAITRKYMFSILLAIIGSTAKFNTLFVLIPVYLLYIRRELKKDNSFINFIYYTTLFFLVTFGSFLAIQALISIPIINIIGFESWLNQSIFGAIKWHTSVKCAGAACPASSAPWDWFLGANGFVLYYISSNDKLVALGYWPLWALALAFSILFIPAYRIDRKTSYSWLFLLGILSGYILLWIIGGRTQYSFYSVQLAPFVYSFLAPLTTYIIVQKEKILYVLNDWYKLFKYLWRIVVELLTS
ncbi:glycosyl transferase, family 39 [Staphylothermus marinus F1]|uniref:Glycosyl transferase, family 39 n=1 Tax=Staphylothermus marinus (strain ATCC 43588 / DSM 3639 / JCM 9404 / F1) TaxID=399550 RepID=A3DMX1_STAMF|nr:glycosyltransferase family 39 protein [Staphylothermus marinus]ABN69981.1 glycosyl transferase, family 39 [Staphylothermus marinus F1]